MKKRVNIITVAVLMALVGLATYIITYSMVQRDFNRQVDTFSSHRREWGPFYAALDNIEKRYIGEADSRLLMQGAIAGMVGATGDAWSHYFNPEAFQNYLATQSNQYTGIGVQVARDETPIRIIEVTANSPAEDAGLLAGDLITHVDGRSVVEMGYETAVGSVIGDEYTTVSLTVERPEEGGGSLEFTVMRRTIDIETVKTAVVEQAGVKTGIIRIVNFNDNVDTQVIDQVGELIRDGVSGIVFDVRLNPGGKLPVLVNILNHLLPEGDLITLRRWDGTVVTHRSEGAGTDIPMAVIIDRDSVSAAEFFAVCLQEYEKAVLIGEQTGGKGYAQEHLRLSDGSAIYLSTSEYVTSKGISLAGKGVTPDVESVMDDEDRRHIGSMDPALDRQLALAIQELRRR